MPAEGSEITPPLTRETRAALAEGTKTSSPDYRDSLGVGACLRRSDQQRSRIDRVRPVRPLRLHWPSLRQPGHDPRQDLGEQDGRRASMLVDAQEQITSGIAHPVRDPALQQVPGSVVAQMAGLAPGPQVPPPASCRVVIHMRRGENDARHARPGQLVEVRPASLPAPPIAPCSGTRVEPSPVRQAAQLHPVRAFAPFALAAGALKADASADFGPVGRIQ